MAEKQNASSRREQSVSARAKDPGFWREMWHQIRLVFALIRDPEVPIYLKLLPVAAVLYVLFPLDFAPDVYPVLGQLDDLTALLVGAKVFIELAPPHVVARHLSGFSESKGAAEVNDDLKDAIFVDAEHEIIGEDAADDN